MSQFLVKTICARSLLMKRKPVAMIAIFLLVSFHAFAGNSNFGYAAEERLLDKDSILENLIGAKVIGEGFIQTFGDPRGAPSASTTYWQGNNASYGRWQVKENQYCSQWPPNDAWSCYDLYSFERDNKPWVVWIDSAGKRYEGMLADN